MLAANARYRSMPVAQPLPLGHSSRGQAKERGRISNTRHCASEDAPENIMNFINGLRTFVRNEEGQDLLEYALLVALIAIVAVVAVTAAGGKVSAVFNKIATDIPS
jgi:pilus assembly protein Flp/PilA